MITAVAAAAHPDDPEAACQLALDSVQFAAGPEADRPMDTSDLDPETGEAWGVVPEGEVWVITASTRDDDGRVAFTAYWADGQYDYLMRLSTFEAWQAGGGRTVRVLTEQQAMVFDHHREEAAS
jgi:hypothetical protein